MNIKVGQWVREDGEYFGKIEKFTGEYSGMYRTSKYDMEQQFLLDHKHNLRVNEFCNIKVADTPKELVRVGDLVEFEDGDRMFVSRFDGNVITHSFNKMAFVRVTNRIVAIYTPNANKTQYTEQWRSDEE